MKSHKLNLLDKLRGLQTTSNTLLEVAIYLETISRVSVDDKNMQSLADKCRQAIDNINEIL